MFRVELLGRRPSPALLVVAATMLALVVPAAASAAIELLQVNVPGSTAVLPPGPYMLFVNKRTAKGLQPSAAQQLTLY
jgi:hypothetical protein